MPTSNGLNAKPERLYSLDCLRGLAALSVVFWHWQHFFFVGTVPGSFDVARLPLSGTASPLYAYGYLAVPLFFTLSGFVFYWLYSKPIAQREMGFRRFAVLRLSRLYPLHLLTLIVVALEQIWRSHELGNYFVYPYNDSYHFFLNLIFASSWGLERGYSFNAPIWSVSVEVLLYILFFLACRGAPARLLTLIFFSLGGCLVAQEIYGPLGQGITSFFLGGACALVARHVLSSPHARAYSRAIGLVCCGLWLLTLAFAYSWLDLSWVSSPLVAPAARALSKWFPIGLLFPMTVLALATAELLHGPIGKRLAWLGDISYSSYLWHFPLQLLATSLAAKSGYESSLFYHPAILGGFFAALIAISLCSHHLLEMPAQEYMRARLLGPDRRLASTA